MRHRLSVGVASDLIVVGVNGNVNAAADSSSFINDAITGNPIITTSDPGTEAFNWQAAAGPKLAPRLLAELGAVREVFADPEALQCYAGAAPVTRQSGRSRFVAIRRACNMHLRATVHLWADRSRVKAPWAEAYYRHKREQGHGHASALRCLGMRWLNILWKMWTQRTKYDGDRHLRDQIKHGSWVISLMPKPVTQSH